VVRFTSTKACFTRRARRAFRAIPTAVLSTFKDSNSVWGSGYNYFRMAVLSTFQDSNPFIDFQDSNPFVDFKDSDLFIEAQSF